MRAFHNIYNPSLAVRVLPLIATRFPDVRLTMVGPDKRDGSLENAHRVASKLGVTQHVEFRPAVDKRDVPGVLERGDIFLNTTNVDNAPVSVIEAMACGLCVVTTNVGGIPYLVEHERDGLLVPPDDAQALAGAVFRILDDHSLAGRLSRNGRQKAERFDWPPIIAEWKALFASVAGSTFAVSARRAEARDSKAFRRA
jgi:glycosyltransferase involved in cell wall biosynthesis